MISEVNLRSVGSNAAADLTVRICRTWDEVLSLRSQWNELLASSESKSISLTWEWISSCRTAYGEREVFLLACFGNDGELVGIAPFYKSRWPQGGRFGLSILRLLGDDTDDSGNLGLIIRRGHDLEVANAFLRWLEANKEWDVLELNYLADSDAFRKLVVQRNWVVSERDTPHLILTLPSSWDGFLASLSRKHRSVLSTRLRTLDHHKVQIRRCEDVEEVSSAVDHLIRLHTARWREQGIEGAFAGTQRRNFYFELARNMLARDMLDCWTLAMDGAVVAVEFGCIYGDTRIAMQSGFDPAYRSFGIGMVLEAKVIEAAIDSGLKAYDFLAGDHWFKRRWGAERESYVSMRCSHGRTLGKLWVGLGKIDFARALGRLIVKSIV